MQLQWEFLPNEPISVLSALFRLRFSHLRDLRLVRFLCVFLLVAHVAWSQQNDEVHIQPRPSAPSANASPDAKPGVKDATLPRFISNVNLVLVPVTVTDPFTRIVTGLRKENFEIFENNLPQEIRYFYSQDAPISVGVIFDTSWSMAQAINLEREAVVEFMKTSNPEDEFFLISFSNQPKLMQDFTQDDAAIRSELVYTVPNGDTALLDAIYLGLSKMRNARYPRKALLIISDGGENNSRYNQKDIRRIAPESDVQIYTIGIAGRDYAPGFLRAITDGTGGGLFTGEDLADTAVKISAALRNEYVIGYISKDPIRDGKWRKIKVMLRAPSGLPQLHLAARTGYYVPTQ